MGSLVLKTPHEFTKWLSNQNLPGTERNRFITLVIGMSIGARLQLPSSLNENNVLVTNVAREQWNTLHRTTATMLVNDFNEIIPHDMTESVRTAELFWITRYRVAAPRTVIHNNHTVDFDKDDAKSVNVLSALFGIDDYFSPAEIFFINKYSSQLISGFNLINSIVSENGN